MTCTDPEIGKLLALYELGALEDAERLRVENHLLVCDECFQSAAELSPVIERMRDSPQSFLPALEAGPSGRRFSESLRAVVDWLKGMGRVPLSIRIGAPVGAALMVVLLLVLWPAERLSDLARIEPAPYRPMSIKAGGLESDADRVFRDAMADYLRKDYAAATGKLEKAVRKEPQNGVFRFYLGLCCLLSGQVDQAIGHLQAATSLHDESVQEKAYWYLGNAWLLKEDREAALVAFRAVERMDGDHEWEAKEMISELGNKSRR